MYELRTYQQRAVDNSVKYLTGRYKKPGIVIIPTGGGKSLVIGCIVRKLNAPTLVLQPSKEILLQNYEKAVSFGMNPTIYSASCGRKELSTLTYATLRSVKHKASELVSLGVNYVLVDECHIQYSAEIGSEFMTFMEEMGNVRVLGFTATPCRLRNYFSLDYFSSSRLNFLTKDVPNFFKQVVHVTQVQELISRGYWSPIKYEVWSFDESDLVLNSNGSEYTESSIRLSIEKNGINNTIYKRLLVLLKKRKHILVCMDSVRNCEIISRFMNNKFGKITDFISGTTPPKKREGIINDFKNGTLKIVFNYSAIATGFDFPELDCLVLGRPTFSFVVYSQFLGRGIRVHKDKEYCLVVDCCNNYSRFGAIENISIEDFPERGWCIFSGNRLITGIDMDREMFKDDMIRRYNHGRWLDEMIGDYRRMTKYDDVVMKYGKYSGKKYCEIPLSYIYKLVDRNVASKELLAYYNEVID